MGTNLQINLTSKDWQTQFTKENSRMLYGYTATLETTG